MAAADDDDDDDDDDEVNLYFEAAKGESTKQDGKDINIPVIKLFPVIAWRVAPIRPGMLVTG